MRLVPVPLVLLVACGGSGIYPRATDEDAATDTPSTSDTGAEGDADTDADADADADSDTDTDTDAPTDTSTPPGAWSHAIAVDGDVSDWTADEALCGTPGETWFGWDATNLYVAVRNPDVSAGTAEHWVLVYLGTPAAVGTTDGVTFNTQQPKLPLPMSHLVRWKADDSFDSLETWTGAAWTDQPGWLGTGGSAKQESNANNVLELAIPRATIGVVDQVAVHVSWLFEGAGFESSYAACPAGSFVDGYDPDFTQFWLFDVTAAAAPASYSPMP